MVYFLLNIWSIDAQRGLLKRELTVVCVLLLMHLKVQSSDSSSLFEVSKQVALGLNAMANLSFGEYQNHGGYVEDDVKQLSVHLYLHLCSNIYLLTLACRKMFVEDQNQQ